MDDRPDSPESYQQDLNPQYLAGRNQGNLGPDTTQGTPASDFKALQQELNGLSRSELSSLPVVPAGTRLEQGKTYIDLERLDAGEFTAMASDQAGPDNRYVAKDAVDYDTWNLLRGRRELTPNPDHPAPDPGPE